MNLQQTSSRLSQNRWADGTVSPGTVSLGDLDPGLSGSWRSVTLQLSAFGLPCTSPPPPSANARLPGLLLQPSNQPHGQDRNQHGWCMDSP